MAVVVPVAFGAYKDILYPGAENTFVMGISPNDEYVVGTTDTDMYATDAKHFLYDNKSDSFTLLEHSSGNTVPYDINNSGVIVGSVNDLGCFRFDGTNWTFFRQDIVAGGVEWAYGINDAGIIVGTNRSNHLSPETARGFVYDGSTFNQIIYEKSGASADVTYAYGIDNRGRICGAHFSYSDPIFHGYIYYPDTQQFESIDYPGENITATILRGINNEGQIAGWYSKKPHSGGNSIGLFWLYAEGGFTYDIETGVFKDVPITDPTVNYLMATDIDDHGKVVGNYGYADPATGTINTVIGFITDEDETDCEEEDNGALDVVGQSLCTAGVTIDVPIRIQNEYKPTSPPPPAEILDNSVSNFLFTITYDPSVLEFIAVVPNAELLQGFEGDFNEYEPGKIIVGGYSITNKIAADVSDVLCHVRFTVLTALETRIDLIDLDDDFRGWSTSHACLSAPVLPEWELPGDLDFSGKVSPLDAGCAAEEGTGNCQTVECGSCNDFECDVNLDCDCSASDALCILNRSIKKPSCIDIEIAGTWSGTLPPDNSVVLNINTDGFGVFSGGAPMTKGDFVNYSNHYDHAIVRITHDPDPANIGLYLKLEWVLSGGSLTLVPYETNSTVKGAIEEQAAGTPFILTATP
ncbi:MAG: cohesin domain-containing protein [Thermodesulfobacteriota bacterium]